MPSCIQDQGPDPAPCKHPHWAAGQKPVPSVGLPDVLTLALYEVYTTSNLKGTLLPCPLCAEQDFSPPAKACQLSLLRNKGEYESFPLRINPNCNAMHFLLRYFFLQPRHTLLLVLTWLPRLCIPLLLLCLLNQPFKVSSCGSFSSLAGVA